MLFQNSTRSRICQEGLTKRNGACYNGDTIHTQSSGSVCYDSTLPLPCQEERSGESQKIEKMRLLSERRRRDDKKEPSRQRTPSARREEAEPNGTTGKATTRARGGERNRKAAGGRARALTPRQAAANRSARTPTAPTPAREQPADATQSRGRQSARRRPGNRGGHAESEPPTAAAGRKEKPSTHGRRKRHAGTPRGCEGAARRCNGRWISQTAAEKESRRTDKGAATNCAK